MAYASTINEDKFLVKNFVSGCTLYRIETNRTDVKAVLEDEYKTAHVLYTGSQSELGGLVYTYLAIVDSNVHWHDVSEVLEGIDYSLFMVADEHTRTYYEHMLLEL